MGKIIQGNLFNLFTDEIYPAEVEIQNGLIKCVRKVEGDFKNFILPGFIDSHIHIESSMLTPSRFAEAVVPHGTTGVVADPHEIANVMGLSGVEYMIQDASGVPLKVFFTASSCVPATPFETAGADLGPSEIDKLLEMDDVVALGEMMNFPGVLGEDPVVYAKIKSAMKHRKPVDGHAPLLSGTELCKYIKAGISTDHECTLPEEALEKRSLGMKIMIREGSSARNLEDLLPVGGDFLVSDDRHPEDLQKGHLDLTLKKAVDLGLDLIEAVKMVTTNPATHYNLNTGIISPGKPADLVIVDDLLNFNVKKVIINGEIVAADGKALFKVKPLEVASTFNLSKKSPEDFEIGLKTGVKEALVRVIEVIEGQLLTDESEAFLTTFKGVISPDVENDILKIAVVERYGHNQICNAFVHGFNLKKGAIASSVAHDSHNIVVVGTSGHEMAQAVNHLVSVGGGLVAACDGEIVDLKLPVAGLMSTENADTVSASLESLHVFVKNMGCNLKSPFMSMSFLALLVIPHLKMSDQGLFDVDKFEFVDLIKK